ncbi:hypothetical protein GCM10028807_36300 [Spirosoma daeguense]
MKSFSLPALLATLTFVVAIWTTFYKPSVAPPNKLDNLLPVLAFEFAQTDQDIHVLFLDKLHKPATDFIAKMRFLTRLDFAFILFYTLFILTFIREARQLVPSSWMTIALFLTPVIGFCDVIENIQLLHILDKVEANVNVTFQQELYLLSIATWFKWELTGLLFLFIIPFLWQGGHWSKGMVIFSIIVFITGIIALVQRLAEDNSIYYAQIFAILVLTLFVLFVFYSITKRLVQKTYNWL